MGLLTLTEDAWKQVNRAVHDERGSRAGRKGSWIYLRVGITGGGCSGFEYNIDLVGFGDPSPKDIIWDQTDPIPGDHADAPIRIAVDPVSAQYLKGCVIDYVRDGLQSGFRFANPMAKAQCGCGRSFSA